MIFITPCLSGTFGNIDFESRFTCFGFCFIGFSVWGLHLAVLRAYFCIWSQRSLLVGLTVPKRVLMIELELVIYNKRATHCTLFLSNAGWCSGVTDSSEFRGHFWDCSRIHTGCWGSNLGWLHTMQMPHPTVLLFLY